MEEKQKETLKNQKKRKLHDENGNFAVGNPGGPGRPKGSFSVVDIIKRKAQEKAKGMKNQKMVAEVLVDELFNIGAKGRSDYSKILAIKEVIDRIDGKAIETVITKDGGNLPDDEFEKIDKDVEEGAKTDIITK